eukprot:SAG11_NODE_11270_length_771_cov_3.875000_1_plen_52_part_01
MMHPLELEELAVLCRVGMYWAATVLATTAKARWEVWRWMGGKRPTGVVLTAV